MKHDWFSDVAMDISQEDYGTITPPHPETVSEYEYHVLLEHGFDPDRSLLCGPPVPSKEEFEEDYQEYLNNIEYEEV